MGSPSDTSYDVVVIGAGLGGLSAAGCLARSGKRVLVVERQEGQGGNAHAFRRGPYTFDPAIHVTGQGYNVPFMDFYLSALGVKDRVEFVQAEEFVGIHVPGRNLIVPCKDEALRDFLAGEFPEDADGVRGFIDLCIKATVESQQPPPRVGIKDLQAAMETLPTLFRYRNSTLDSVLDEFVTSPECRSVLGAWWPYLGLPPSRLSYLAYGAMLMAIGDPGPLYPKGGFQTLADAVALSVTDNGGEIVFDTTVTGISLDAEGNASGIELDGGGRVTAPVVISNADARQTFRELVGVEHLPDRFVRRLDRMRPSSSAFVLFSATTMDPREHGLAHEGFIQSHLDHDEAWAAIERGEPGGAWYSVPTMHDRSLAPEGEHIVLFTSLASFDIGEPWADAKPRFEQLCIDMIDGLMPGYRDSLTFVESATPQTLHDYTLASDGACYGWDNAPDQTTPKRLDNRTPIPGLYLSGHWTQPGSGSIRALFSGAVTAAAVTGLDDPIAQLASLQG